MWGLSKQTINFKENLKRDSFNENYEAEVEIVTVPDLGTVLKTRISNNGAPDIINIYPQNADFQLWAYED